MIIHVNASIIITNAYPGNNSLTGRRVDLELVGQATPD